MWAIAGGTVASEPVCVKLCIAPFPSLAAECNWRHNAMQRGATAPPQPNRPRSRPRGLTDRRVTRARRYKAQRKSWRLRRGGDSMGALQRNSFKLALAQMLVEGGRKEANLRRALERINEAAANGAQVVVLPETMTLGWTHWSATRDADKIPEGDCCLRLREAARGNRIYVCVGLVERAGLLVFNSAVLIDPSGEVILCHRKLNELEIAHEFYAPGDRLGVAPTPLGTFGVMICADAFARGQVV